MRCLVSTSLIMSDLLPTGYSHSHTAAQFWHNFDAEVHLPTSTALAYKFRGRVLGTSKRLIQHMFF